jgi:tryptophanyl-tRNA synthetase
MRILSGIKPSGTIHIGNYLGMIRPMVESQEKGELFCFVANLHSLTSVYDREKMISYTNDAIIDLLSLGIDPEKSVFWVQSDVPEVAEITWYLNNITPVGLLERSHAYKDALARGLQASNGLFSYPVLMAADILAYQANRVPVGKDQKQHLEIARDLAIKFNSTYGDVFTIPEPEIKDDLAVIPGIDGQKMSKSYGNTIEIFGDEKSIRKKVMSIVTDSTPVDAPKDPGNNIIFNIYKHFASDSGTEIMAERFRAGGYGYGEAKQELFNVLWNYFAPFRKRREELKSKPGLIKEIRENGASKARKVISSTLERVRSLVGVD